MAFEQTQAPWWVWMVLLGILAAMAWLTTPAPSYANPPHPQLAMAETGVFMAGVYQQQRVLPILFLGDGQYSGRSAHAAGVIATGESQGTCAVVGTLPTQTAQPWVLRIDRVMGLDTAEAHAAGQSSASTTSTPATVWVNDRVVGELRHNNRPYTFPLLTRTPATIAICTGQRLSSLPTDPVDHDDIQVIGVRVVQQ